MGIQVIRPDDGERIAMGPIGARIIEDGSHTQHRLGLIEATLPPGPAQPPQHVHHEHDEVFIVTAGRMRFTSGEESVDVDAGTVVVAPVGVPHTFSNPFQQTAVFIGTMTPDLYIQYFRDLGQLALDQRGMLNPSDVARTMARYATDVVSAPASTAGSASVASRADGQPTCGQGLAANATLPARLGEVASAMAELLEQHTRALDLANADGRLELVAYGSLARAYRGVASDLAGLSQQMAAYRDLGMGPHDVAVMTDPNGQAAAFQRLIAAERDLLEALRTNLEQHGAMSRPAS